MSGRVVLALVGLSASLVLCLLRFSLETALLVTVFLAYSLYLGFAGKAAGERGKPRTQEQPALAKEPVQEPLNSEEVSMSQLWIELVENLGPEGEIGTATDFGARVHQAQEARFEGETPIRVETRPGLSEDEALELRRLAFFSTGVSVPDAYLEFLQKTDGAHLTCGEQSPSAEPPEPFDEDAFISKSPLLDWLREMKKLPRREDGALMVRFVPFFIMGAGDCGWHAFDSQGRVVNVDSERVIAELDTHPVIAESFQDWWRAYVAGGLDPYSVEDR